MSGMAKGLLSHPLRRLFVVVAIVTGMGTLLGACQNSAEQAPPQPVPLSEDAVGHYCQMYVLDHGGPKAQIHLVRIEAPLWFAQVSEAVSYVHDPEQMAEIAAIYVTDMGQAKSWSDVGATNWIAAKGAFYVIESKRMGGMGTPEAIPFARREEADAFAREHGGRVVGFDDIPEAYVRAGSEFMANSPPADGAELGRDKNGKN